MSQKGFILKNVLRGILLGLVIITGWLFYPDIQSLFKSSTPWIADKITTMKQKIVSKKFPVLQEKDELSLTEISGKKAEDTDTPDMPEPGRDEATDALTKDIVHKPVSQDEGSGTIKPFNNKMIMYAFFRFDDRTTAEDFMENIEKRSGVDLWLGQEDYMYVVYIPAADEQEKKEKADLIKKKTGITGN